MGQRRVRRRGLGVMMLLVIVQLRLGSGKPVKPVNVLGVDAVEDAPRMPTGSGPAPPHWPLRPWALSPAQPLDAAAPRARACCLDAELSLRDPASPDGPGFLFVPRAAALPVSSSATSLTRRRRELGCQQDPAIGVDGMS